MTSERAPDSLEIVREIRATPERVFRALHDIAVAVGGQVLSSQRDRSAGRR